MFIKDNYLRTYGNGNSFMVEIDPPKNPNANFHEESRKVAEMVWNNRQGKVHVMYSGGVDSEYVLSTFISLGMDVTPVIIKLNPGYNEHDVKYAFDFCESKKLKPIIVDLNYDHFVKTGEILDLALPINCATHRLPSTYKVVSQLDGTVVMGSHGPPHMALVNDIWYVDEYEIIHNVLKFFNRHGIHGCPFFLAYTAEQYLSYLLDPYMQALANNQVQGKLGNNSSKYLTFSNGSGFRLVARKKYTGFENVEESPIFQHENIKYINSLEDEYGGVCIEPYFDLIKRLKNESNNLGTGD